MDAHSFLFFRWHKETNWNKLKRTSLVHVLSRRVPYYRYLFTERECLTNQERGEGGAQPLPPTRRYSRNVTNYKCTNVSTIADIKTESAAALGHLDHFT